VSYTKSLPYDGQLLWASAKLGWVRQLGKCHQQSGFPLEAVRLEAQKQDLAIPEDIIRGVVYAGPALVGPRQRWGGVVGGCIPHSETSIFGRSLRLNLSA